MKQIIEELLNTEYEPKDLPKHYKLWIAQHRLMFQLQDDFTYLLIRDRKAPAKYYKEYIRKLRSKK